MGLVQDETDLFFTERELKLGITPKTKDRYLRTLVRNTFTFHLNEIFATIQNEYTDWTNAEAILHLSDGQVVSKDSSSYLEESNPYLIQHETSMALTDKLYTAPIQQVRYSLLYPIVHMHMKRYKYLLITCGISNNAVVGNFRLPIGLIVLDIRYISMSMSTLRKLTKGN